MHSKIKRTLAFFVALALTVSLAGCKQPDNDGSSVEYEVVKNTKYTYVTQSGETVTVDGSSQSGTATDNSSQTQTNTNTEGYDWEHLRGTTVKFAATIHPDNDESGPVVKAFQEKYGIKVEIVECNQDIYAQEIQGLIAAGDSPDVVRSNGDFPLAMSYLQSLTAAKLNYSDAIWDQNMFKMTTFDGEPYLCNTMGNIWNEMDIVVYRKSLLSRANCYTPEEYDANGKWNWDAFYEICRATSKLDGVTQPGTFQSFEVAAGMGAAGLFKLENGQFVSNVDSHTIKVFTKLAEGFKEGIIKLNSNSTGIVDGSTAICVSQCYMLKKKGTFRDADWSDLGFYYLPDFDSEHADTTTGMMRGWGLARGAKNPEAAGAFMRYYLDVNNYDTSDAFITPEAENFFFVVTTMDYQNWMPQFGYSFYTQSIAGFDYTDDFWYISKQDPAQVPALIAKAKDIVAKGASNINSFVKQNIGFK